MQDKSQQMWPTITVSGPLAAAGERVRFSLPVPKGQLTVESPLALCAPDNTLHTLQTRPLAVWADGTVRWLDCQALLSRPGAYAVVAQAAPPPEQPVRCRERDDAIDLDNGLVAVTLAAKGPSPLAAIRAGESSLTHPELPFEARVETGDGAVFSSACEPVRRLRIRERGPVRTVVEIEGAHLARDGRKALSYRLRVTLTAGQPVIGLQYGFHHDDPGIATHCIRELSIRTRWPGTGQPRHYVHQGRYGMTTITREVQTRLPVDIRSNVSPPRVHVHDTACFEDPHAYPAYLNPPLNDTQALAGVEADGGWITAWVEDFKELCPKGLAADGDALRLDIWPRWAPVLELPQGRSRDISLHLVFTGARAPDVRTVTARVRAVDDSLKATVPASWYAAQRCWYADALLPRGAAARGCDRYLARLATVPTVVGMWDLGDTMDPGYGRTYAGVGRLRRLPSDGPPYYQAGGLHNPVVEWWEPGKFEPVWTNNEYDLILALCREALRGNATPDLWQRLRWFARHAIEVDFICHSDDSSQHHGSPAHSADHSHAGAYPSHLWCEGLLAYYCLSGDDDAREVAVAVGDFILRTFGDADRRRKLWHFSRELGWALIYLSTAADITGEQRFLDSAGELAAALIAEPLTPDRVRDMTAYAFGYASIAMGVEALWKVTPRPELAQWLVSTAQAIAAHCEADTAAERSAMVLNYFNAALEVGPDDRLVRCGLRILNDLAAAKSWKDPLLFAKPVAMAYRSVSRFAAYAHAAGLLADGRMDAVTAPI